MNLQTIKVGSLVEGPAIFGAMEQERIALTAVEVRPTVPKTVVFKASFFGVSIGKVVATEVLGAEPSWAWEQS